jgi:hypothetical protein
VLYLAGVDSGQFSKPCLEPDVSNALHYRAKIASLTRSRQPDDPDLVAARQNLKALRLEEHVRKVVAEAPPLTDEQRERITALLRAGAS